MPTLNKLEYLDETKQQIKNALNTNFNSQIQDTDTFRSYVSKINDIYTNWAKVTGEGTTLNLTPTKKGRLQSTLKGATSQDGTPTPETPIPIKVVTGEQNVNISSRNLFQIKDADYTAQSAWSYQGNNAYTKISNGYILSGSRYTAIGFQYDNLEVGEEYTISFDVIADETLDYSSAVGINQYSGADASVKAQKTFTVTNTLQRISWTFTAHESDRIAFRTGIITITNIQLEKGSTATEYVPYQEQTYPISLGVKNLFDGILELGGYVGSTGEKSLTTDNYRNANIISVNPNTTYTFSINGVKQKYVILTYGVNQDFKQQTLNDTGTYTTANDEYYINFRCYQADFTSDFATLKVQLEEGATASSYTPYGQTPIELAKIDTYQDYIYGSPNNWYKKSAITKINLSSLTWALRDWGFRANTDLSNIVTPANTNIMAILLCNVYEACTPNNAYGLTGSLEHGISLYGNTILVRETIIRDLNDFNSMISSASAYLLNIEPTTTQITDTTLITQLNNLYNATSQEGTTYITCSSASDSNETVIINATALMKGGN